MAGATLGFKIGRAIRVTIKAGQRASRKAGSSKAGRAAKVYVKVSKAFPNGELAATAQIQSSPTRLDTELTG